ncbi:2-oxo acid dehydrogenase subunit E2 [Candidatus Marinimicrobia bacterium MT.SAG.3]|nr:2-oxo acid dehydrogenase subunit E2 [Candidatus Marinimicrobia bacterium MT.SAG.3]
MKIDMVMPKLGESIAEATVIKWLKQPGDRVEEDDVVLEISTDKVDSEIPSPGTGFLSKIIAQEGETVEVGTIIAEIVTEESELEGGNGEAPTVADEQTEESADDRGVEDETAVEEATEESEVTVEKKSVTAPAVDEQEVSGGKFYSPLVRSIARKEGVSVEELDKITGTGAGGRVTKTDLLSYIGSGSGAAVAVEEVKELEEITEVVLTEPETSQKEEAVEVEEPPKSAPKPVDEIVVAKKELAPGKTTANIEDEVVPMDRMRKAISEHMVRSVKTSPHVFIISEVDMKNIVDFREDVKNAFLKRENFKLTYTPFIVRAVARALKEYPYLNASVDGDNIILKKSINVGIAVALEKGLIVPVINNADDLDLLQTARIVNELSTKARTKKLMPDDVQGGTFSVTNMGVFGSLAGFPIINQPQVAILGVGAIRKQAVVVNDAITIRPVMQLTIGFDHRIVDGADGAKYLERVSKILSGFDPLIGI